MQSVQNLVFNIFYVHLQYKLNTIEHIFFIVFLLFFHLFFNFLLKQLVMAFCNFLLFCGLNDADTLVHKSFVH